MTRRSDAPLPEVGSRWKARRWGEEKWTVEVVSADAHFVFVRMLTTAWGDPPRKATTSRLRTANFHYTFEATP